MPHKLNRRIRRECLTYMKSVTAAHFWARLLAIAMPTVNAFLIGNMADHLLQLHLPGILNTLPYFLLALLITVLGEPLATLWLYLHMANQAFAYDVALISRFIRKPLRDIQQVEYGEVMQRFDGDLGDFCWNTVFLFSLPFVLAAYAAVIVWTLAHNGSPLLFALTLVALPALPVLKAHRFGAQKAQLQREMSEYNEQRRNAESDIVPSRDFLRHYGLAGMMQGVLHRLYDAYLQQSGKKKRAFDSRETMLDFLLQHGVPAAVLGVGGFFVLNGSLTAGALLAGSLMLPAIQQCYTYGATLAEQVRTAPEYMDRLALFYGTQEEDTPQPDAMPTTIHADSISFAYQKGAPVLKHFSANLSARAFTRIAGANGSGKSTLVALLGGLYPPDAGAVRDEKGRPLSLRTLRRAVALQEQESAVFSGTIWENLFVSKDAEADAQALAEIFELEKPLTFAVDTNGNNLSPGERKKIMLMRALLKSTPFTILDEPFNHLDAAGRQALLQEMQRRGPGFAIVSHQDLSLHGCAVDTINLPGR